MKKQLKKPINNLEFDSYFENNDISDLLSEKPLKVNIELPGNVLHRLEYRAQLTGLTREALIKYWISEKLGLVK